MKRVISALLLATLVLSFAACSGGGETKETTAAPSATNSPTETTAEPVETEIVPDLPTEKLNGQKVTVMGESSYAFSSGYKMLYLADDQNGDILNDAVIERDRMVEDRLGIDLEYTTAKTADFFAEHPGKQRRV